MFKNKYKRNNFLVHQKSISVSSKNLIKCTLYKFFIITGNVIKDYTLRAKHFTHNCSDESSNREKLSKRKGKIYQKTNNISKYLLENAE